jgi:hypothetical protein
MNNKLEKWCKTHNVGGNDSEATPETEEKWILEFYKETHGFPIYITDWSEGKFDITRVIKSFISEKIKEAYEQGKKEVINGIATKDILTKEIRREVIEEVRDDVVKIINDSKATFFVSNDEIEIDIKEIPYELKAEITTNVEMYFFKLLEEYEK